MHDLFLHLARDGCCLALGGPNMMDVAVVQSAFALSSRAFNPPFDHPLVVSMAPHLTPAELDFITASEAKGVAPIALHQALVRKRARCSAWPIGRQKPVAREICGKLGPFVGTVGTLWGLCRDDCRGHL